MDRVLAYRLLCRTASLAGVVALAACSRQPAARTGTTQQPVSAVPSAQSTVERGKLLVTVAGCNDCHTPKKVGPNGIEPDMSRMLSGHPEQEPIKEPFKPAAGSPWVIATGKDLTAWSGPWGVSFAANLTPDTQTGLRSGVWTEEVFIKAIRSGKHMGTSRTILPPMPWPEFAQLSDDDLKAIWSYLGTIPPIRNHVPDPIPPSENE